MLAAGKTDQLCACCFSQDKTELIVEFISYVEFVLSSDLYQQVEFADVALMSNVNWGFPGGVLCEQFVQKEEQLVPPDSMTEKKGKF